MEESKLYDEQNIAQTRFLPFTQILSFHSFFILKHFCEVKIDEMADIWNFDVNG